MINLFFRQYHKIEHLKIFDYNIVKCKIPKKIYNKKSFKKSINQTFEALECIDICKDTNESIGSVTTTVGLENTNSLILRINNVEELIHYVSEVIMKSFFKKDFYTHKVVMTNMWMNKIYLNSKVRCHTHEKRENIKSGVAIFYLNAPKNGSKLIILKNDIGNNFVTDEHLDISHYLKVDSGDLIIHSSDVPHAVSTHLNIEPRICLVFDFSLEIK